MIEYPAPAPIRDDLTVPVMVVQAEGDVIMSNRDSRQLANTSMIREWEMAGTSHVDAYSAYSLQGLGDAGEGSLAAIMFTDMRGGTLANPAINPGCTYPINAGPHHLIVQAAFHALDTWVRDSVAPPIAPLLNVISSSPVVLERDAHGNALGGVRSPHVDVPVATLGIVNSALIPLPNTPPSARLCFLFGRTTPLSVATIEALYDDQTDFTTQWSDSIDATVTAGFMRPADAPAWKAAAEAWIFPN